MCLFVCETQGLYLPCDSFKSGADAVFVLYLRPLPAVLCAVSGFLFDPHAVSMFASVQIWKEKRGEEGSEGRSAATKVRPPE